MRILGWIFSSLVFLAIVAGVAGFIALQHFSRDLPDYSQLADYSPPITTRLHAADGRLMAEYAVENRLFVPIEAIPNHVIQAFISAEDQNFYNHNGIDFVGILRAVLTNLRNLATDRRLVGASTITQQVAKNFLLSSEVSYERKIREALLSLRIEKAFTKEQILELYLNEIYLGRNSYGVAASALNYFNKPLAELSVAEAAYLAGLPKAPNNYHPIYRREAAIARRNYVIDRMLEDGVLSPATADEARQGPLEVYERPATEFITADYFAEEVRRELQRIYGDEQLYEGGLSVRTSVDPRMQAIATRALRDGLIVYDRRHGWRGPVATLREPDTWQQALGEIALPAGAGRWQLAAVVAVDDAAAEIGFADGSRGSIPMSELLWARPWEAEQEVGPEPTRARDVLTRGEVVLVEPVAVDAEGLELPDRSFGLRQVPDAQGAIVALDPHTGRVMAMTGGYSYEMSEFNRATQAARQPGSAFKPFVYLAALDHGYTPSTILLDSPLAIDLGPEEELYRPENYSGTFLGPTPLRIGVEKSRNLMTVRLLQEIGLEPVRDVARDFDIFDDMPLYYSSALGAIETTPLQLTVAYAMLVNGGRRITPTFVDRVQDRAGRTVFRQDQRPCEYCIDVGWSGQQAPEVPDEREQIADPVSVYQMVSMLEGVVQRGTGWRMRDLGLPLAGKTGTTNDSFDAWFVGFSPDLAIGVFVGFDNPRTLGDGETGSSAAAPIFRAFAGEALAGQEVVPFRIPPGVRLVKVDAATGLRSQPGMPFIWEAFRAGTEPTAMATPRPDPGVAPSPGFGRGSRATSGTGGLY
ncbi:MAG: penicillin-binding protein 1A [Inquilinus sp.]|nr:penicillin-binding protein 1A [Inquilinus sp.]